MLQRNISVPLLVNGSMGTFTGFVWRALRKEQVGELQESVLVKFDDVEIIV